MDAVIITSGMLLSLIDNLTDTNSTGALDLTTGGRSDSGGGCASVSQEGNKRMSAISLQLAFLVFLLIAAAGCQTDKNDFSSAMGVQGTNVTTHFETIVLREGDVLKITFPSAANLNTTTPIRRDGNIVLSLVGEVRAVGKTPAELKDELLKLYAGQIDTKEITVEVMSSTFPVFVVGAVVRPGKVLTDHPITALESIMESGGFDFTKANLKSVIVLRQEAGRLKRYNLNLKAVLDGNITEQFYMKPADIIYVKEKFAWF